MWNRNNSLAGAMNPRQMQWGRMTNRFNAGQLTGDRLNQYNNRAANWGQTAGQQWNPQGAQTAWQARTPVPPQGPGVQTPNPSVNSSVGQQMPTQGFTSPAEQMVQNWYRAIAPQNGPVNVQNGMGQAVGGGQSPEALREGMDYWTGLLGQGNVNQQDVFNQFLQSAGSLGANTNQLQNRGFAGTMPQTQFSDPNLAALNSWYGAMGRAADAPGLQYWNGLLNNGMGQQDVFNQFRNTAQGLGADVSGLNFRPW